MDLGNSLRSLCLPRSAAAIGLGLRYLIPALVGHLKGSFGSATGWATLSSRYGTSAEPEGVVLKRQSLVAGSVVYRYLVTVVIAEAGLYLAVGGPLPRSPVLIPWEDFKGVTPAMLFWQKAALVSIGAPQAADDALRPDALSSPA